MGKEGGVTRIAYQGLEGSFSEAAAHIWAELEGLGPFELVPARNARGVVKAVQSGAADYGMVGVSNSTSGVIGDTLDTMEAVRHMPVATLVLPVVIYLFGLPGDTLDTVRAVYSHPASLYQCERRLKKIIPEVELMASPTSAYAAMQLAGGDLPEGAAVLCSPRAGRLRHLQPLLCPANDSLRNETTFMAFRRPEGHR